MSIFNTNYYKRINFIKYFFNSLIILGLLTISFITQAANIIARTDTASIYLNESFTLIYESNGKVDREPNFSVLEKDFDIINSTQSSNISIVNGQTTQKKTWTLKLFAKQVGLLSIPEISFGKDRSPALQITVKAGNAPVNQKNTAVNKTGEDIFLQVETTPKTAYVQQEILFTVSIYLGVNVSNGNLSVPQLSDKDAIIERIGDDRNYQTNINNRLYQVIERQYLIYPQTPGQLTIGAMRFDASLSRRRSTLFDPFGSRGKPVRVRSKSLTLNIKTIPKNYSGSWLPAKTLSLKESWSENPPQFTIGEPITRTLELSAAGLPAAQLPNINIVNNDDFKQYPDQPSLENNPRNKSIIGTRIEKIALIPTQPGTYTLPAIEIPWWDTNNDVKKIAKIPARKIEVVANTTSANNSTNNASVLTTPEPNTDSPSNITDTKTTKDSIEKNYWPWISLALAIIWILTLIAWFKKPKTQSIEKIKPTKKSSDNLKIHIKNIQTACRKNDKQTAKQALLYWASVYWPENTPYSLGAIAELTEGELQQQIKMLNDAIYKAPEKNWQGADLANAIGSIKPTKNNQPITNELRPLYKLD